jgi:hypothetical protein
MADQVSRLLPDAIITQNGYAKATTALISSLHGDPDEAGGQGYQVCPFGKTVGQLRDTAILDIHDCKIGQLR